MTEISLSGRTVLVAEDEYMLADELRSALADRGAVVIGPAATVHQGVDLLRAEGRLDCAILDVNLRGEPVFPLADELIARGVPFAFTTGYDAAALPQRFLHISRCEKPFDVGRVLEVVAGFVSGR